MGEDKKGIMSDEEIKNGDNPDSFLAEEKLPDRVKNVSVVDEFVDMEDSYNDKNKQTGVSVNPFMIPFDGSEQYQKEGKFYTDKSVTECELPELMVCFKEGPYHHVIKDICIDDGLPSFDKILEENWEVQNNGDFNLQHSDSDTISDLTKERVDGVTSISNWRNPFVEYDYETDAAKHFDSARLAGNGEEGSDENVRIVLDEKAMPEASNLNREMEMCNSHGDIPNEKAMAEILDLVQESDVGNSIDDGSGEKTRLKKSCFAQESYDDQQSDKDQQPHNQDADKHTNSTTSMTPEGSNSCSEANVENGSITYDFDSSPPATIGREEDLKNTDCQQHGETLNMPCSKEGMVDNPSATSGREEHSKNTDSQLPTQTLHMLCTEEDMGDSRTASSRSFFIQHGFGETSFSSAGPQSGPIPNSGSISYRSDSSTTSTRSFAFPVLNSEWNSSPVKMAKADRRNFRKHRGWRASLLCCRFRAQE